MKCVNCGTDNNLKEIKENEGRCKNCNHPFAFNPLEENLMADVFFQAAIKSISISNNLFFTPKQFLYYLEKRLKIKETKNAPRSLLTIGLVISLFGLWIIGIPLAIWGAILGTKYENFSPKIRKSYAKIIQKFGIIGVVLSVLISLALPVSDEAKFLIFLLGTSLGSFGIYFGKRREIASYYIPQKFEGVTPKMVKKWVDRWTEIHGFPEKMLPPPKAENRNLPVSSDISAYSFDRVIVCDAPQIAQFLIANNFYFEHNCAILSIDRYPQSIFSVVMEMLRRNPDLIVYAFHSATPRGVALAHKLRTSDRWFANSDVYIRDLGLLPQHIFSSRNMFILNSPKSAAAAQKIPAAVRENLSINEIEWLEAGNYVELESFSPRRLLRVVSRGISRGGGGGIIAVDHEDSYSLSYDVDDTFG